MENWQIEYIATQCRLALEARGYTIKIVQDFSAIPDLMARLGGRCSPPLDPRRNLFTKTNALWLFVFQDGEPVIGGGVRVDDLGDEDLGSFIQRSLPLTFNVQAEPHPHRIFEGRISGRVAYFGDLKASTARALGRGGDEALKLYTAYGHYRIMKDLRADATYCYLRRVDKRRAENYGFLDTDPWVWKLDRDMYPDGSPKWIGHLRRERLPALLDSVTDLLCKDDQLFLPGHSAHAEAGENVGEACVQGAGH